MGKADAKREFLEYCAKNGRKFIVCSKDSYKDFVIVSEGLEIHPITEDPTGYLPENSANAFETQKGLDDYLDNLMTEIRAKILRGEL